MSSRSQRRCVRRRSLLVLLALLLVGGCGSGDPEPEASAAPPTSAPTVTPTTEAPTEATASDAPAAADDALAADRGTIRLARAATLQRDDYPRGWTVFSPAAPIDPEENRASCSYQAGGPEAQLLSGAIRQGPHMQLRDAPGYAHSQAYVFDDAEAASAWIDYIDSREWARCVRRQLQEFQDAQDSGGRVKLYTRETPALGQGGFSSYASFSVTDQGGEVQAFTDYQFYVLGRTVIRLGLDVGGLSDAQYVDYTDGIDQALQAAYTRVYELEPEAPAS